MRTSTTSCFRALDPDPQERYDSVKDFAEQLQPCLGSTRKGKNALKRLVSAGNLTGSGEELSSQEDFFDDTDTLSAEDVSGKGLPDSEDGLYERASYGSSQQPWRMSSRMRSVCMRIWAALSTGLLAFLGIHSVLGPESWGTQPVAWGILAACIGLTAALPSWGVLVVGEAFGVALCACGAPLPGIVFMVATGAWWFYSARFSVEVSNAGMAGVIFGAIGTGTSCSVCGRVSPVCARCAYCHLICSLCCCNTCRIGFGILVWLGCDYFCTYAYRFELQ